MNTEPEPNPHVALNNARDEATEQAIRLPREWRERGGSTPYPMIPMPERLMAPLQATLLAHTKRNKINRITQYRPAFFEGFKNQVVEFNTTEELLAIPFLQGFKHKGFHQWSLSGQHLMAEYREGKEWWVAGYIRHPEAVDLPQWNHGVYETTEGDFPGTEVAWSCGSTVKLRDGRELTKKEEIEICTSPSS